jgi:hypothetical protein
MFAPDRVDRLSTLYLLTVRLIFRSLRSLIQSLPVIRRVLPHIAAPPVVEVSEAVPAASRPDWVVEWFPYEASIRAALQRDGMQPVIDLVAGLNESHGTRNNNRFFGFCKLFIEAHSEPLAKQVRQGEAPVRFLSGTCVALIFSATLGLLAAVLFSSQRQWLPAQMYGFLTLFSITLLAAIFQRFKFQRRREVVVVWSSLYLLLFGAVPNGMSVDIEELRRRFKLSTHTRGAVAG